MGRLTDWRSRLQNTLADNAHRAFEPGVHDCSTFTGSCVDAVTGTDYAAPYRGQYTTIEEGLDLIQAAGFADQVELVASIFPEIPVLQASSGDIAAISIAGQRAIGIVIDHSVAVVTETRLGHLPLSKAERVFKV